MDREFSALHNSILNEVEATLKSIDLNFRVNPNRKARRKYYENLRTALLLWKDMYGNPENDDDVINGIVYLKNTLSEMR